MDDSLGILGILINITRDLYGIDINMIINDPSTINTICTNVKENFLRPSLQDLLSKFGAELMSAYLPRAAPICANWQGFLEGAGIDSTSPVYSIIQDGARIGSQVVGYDDREDLCQHLEQALSVQEDNNAARRTFSMDIISEIFDTVEEADRCTSSANDAIDNVILPLIRVNIPAYVLSNDDILAYTGIDGGVAAVCTAMENAVTYEIDLPDPVPVQLIPETTLTVEFFLNAVGGIWQQDRLIDSLAFVCTDVLPELESMVPDFESYVKDSWDYKPVCGRIREAASNLEEFDATEFCKDLTKIVNDLIYGPGTDERVRRQEDPYMYILDIIANITKELYNIDINDPSTICPNIAQFLDRSIPDIISEFGAKLMVVYLPNIDGMLCEDWDQTLESFGVNSTSAWYQLVQNGARIVFQAVGYESRQALCQEINRVLAITGDDNEERQTFARNIIESSFEIYTNNDRCSMYFNDAIDDIIEPIFEIENLQIKISDYTIYRYTGYMGVEGVCEAMETDFTKLSTSTVTMTLTGEYLNGEILVFTDDLKNQASPRFKKLETLYCGVMGNHLRRELGSDLRGMDCKATSFSAGSIIAELEIEIHAYTQDDADSLAEDAVDLSTSGTLVLSSEGDTLTVSSLQGSGSGSAGQGGDGGLAKGSIIGIAVAATVVFLVVAVIIIAVVVHSKGKGTRDTERGVGLKNPGFSKDEHQYKK
ncbi:uncharacterized protein LOC105445927 [Strongylocentrotus purpuratus]|uniref:Uncharacterized protein n=1 Tax=Strongylocentrotus purpuratus TaxID=7668 RepID=A0A7M7P055_STRPU|nr:uncharacterized protein LOC105445927 [Strongylocentrotus purpuratus]